MFSFCLLNHRNERICGFYKGLGAYMLHVIPNICIVFLVYEGLLTVFDDHKHRSSHRTKEITLDEEIRIKAKLELTRCPNIDQTPVVPIRVKPMPPKDNSAANGEQTYEELVINDIIKDDEVS